MKSSRSLCPVCLKLLNLEYIRRDDDVFLSKECDEHGSFEIPIWRGLPDIDDWMMGTELTRPSKVLTTSVDGCPFDCGVCPEHKQQACCVVIEITSRCNQSCPVCYASSSKDTCGPDDRPVDEIISDLKFLKEIGETRPFNLQFSGGEPSLRDDLPEILRAASALGFPYLQLNTNGRRLAEEPGYASTLKDSGLSAVFLQFDGLSDDVYIRLRGEALAEKKRQAVTNCAAAGLGVVLVMTLVQGVNDHQLGGLVKYLTENLPAVRGLHLQPVSCFGRYPEGRGKPRRITMPEVFAALELQLGDSVKADYFKPLSSGHPLCSFHGRFYLGPEKEIVPLINDKAESPGSFCCCSGGVSAIMKARDFLSEKWTMPSASSSQPVGAAYNVSAWDEYLQLVKQNGFSITGMLFQDADTLDLDRLSSCRVHVLAPNRRLIPFCAYNLSSRNGMTLYRRQLKVQH
ncbi:MAG: radical SAM protein [Spirochaetales bacterium]|nr:radical SAM protein [Spirochaetales bacterium]